MMRRKFVEGGASLPGSLAHKLGRNGWPSFEFALTVTNFAWASPKRAFTPAGLPPFLCPRPGRVCILSTQTLLVGSTSLSLSGEGELSGACGGSLGLGLVNVMVLYVRI